MKETGEEQGVEEVGSIEDLRTKKAELEHELINLRVQHSGHNVPLEVSKRIEVLIAELEPMKKELEMLRKKKNENQ